MNENSSDIIKSEEGKPKKPTNYILFVVFVAVAGIIGYLSGTLSTFRSFKKSAEQARAPEQAELPILSEQKLDIQERDLRLKYYQADDLFISFLVDYTPKPHTPSETDVEKVTTLPQQNIIIGWERRQRQVIPNKVLLSSDQRFLIISSVLYGISIYDYQEDVLTRSLEILRPEVSGASLVKIEDGKLFLGLADGRGGICDENAYSVSLEDFTVKLLQPKEAMKRC